MYESGNETLAMDRCNILLWPDGRAAIRVHGQSGTHEPHWVTLEVNLETLTLLRAELAKAELFLMP